MNRMPPPEGPHAPPSAHGGYQHQWRHPYPPPYESHESRRPSTSSAPLPPQTYPVMPNRELPQLPPDGPYGRTNSLPGPPSHPVQESSPVHANYRPPMNGTPHESSPHSAPPEYRRMGFQPPEQPTPTETTPTSGSLPPSSQFMTPAPPIPPGTPGPYDPSYYQNPAYGARQRKAARAQQACDQCRARKAKCDEGRPACSHCKENSLICVYKEVPPHKQEKTAQLLLDRLMEMEDKLADRIGRIEKYQYGQGQILEQILGQGCNDSSRALKYRTSAPIPPQEPVLETEAPAMQPMQSMQNMQGMQAVPTMSTDAPAAESPSYGQQNNQPMNANPRVEDQLQDDKEGELSIPVEHTTAAHKLLMWPSIKRLLYPHEYDEDYVMRLEEERGLISVYGQGEISYTADDTQLPSPPLTRDGGSFDESRSNGGSEIQIDSTGQDSDAEIDKFGLLSLDGKTAWRYYQSYLDRMHNLHPFLDQDELDIKMDTFVRCFCPRNPPPTSASEQPSTFCRENSRPAKRKRSPEDLQGVRGGSADTASASSRPRVGRNIDNATILLVLALGAICETKSPLPGPIMDHKVDYRGQHIPGPLPPLPPAPAKGTHAPHGVLSPANSDSAMQSTTSFYSQHLQTASQSFPSSATESRLQKNLSRRTVSASRDEYGHAKNLQVIPGLSLYGYATTILGLLQGGVELEHVQAGLLAGLYAGQLAHPFQSHGWICQAARACQVLIRQRRYDRLDELTKEGYKFAFWTCLQLESDLLAELDIPASGISRSEGRMKLPAGTTFSLPNSHFAPMTVMMMYYSAQVHLRRVLNNVHTDLYKVEKPGQTRWSSTVQEALSMNLENWRGSLPDVMEWKDSDEPATDINAARMRAKYYGARYIIHRPLLYHALHYGQTGARIGSVGQTSVDSPTGSASASQTQQMSPSMTHTSHRATNMARIRSDMGNPSSGNPSTSFSAGWTPPTVKLRDLPQKLRRACRVCIESAILSTVAFDGIEDRLVVTNIFGTAHAQFGNMLVLSATYMSSVSELVERSTLERLLKRTIRFLLRSENISPTLRADARILTEIYTKIFNGPPMLNQT